MPGAPSRLRRAGGRDVAEEVIQMGTSMGRFVVGIDGSTRAREALQWALSHAGPDHRIEAVHVWDVPVIAGYEGAIAVDPGEIEAAAAQFVADVVAACADARVVAMTARGSPGRALVEAAEGADVLVIGHNGDGRMSMLGSVAQHVLHHTATPVVLARGERTGPARHVVVGVDDHDLGAGGHGGPPGNESVRALRWAYQLPAIEVVDVVHAWFAPAVAAGLYADAGADMARQDAEAVAVIQRVVEAAGSLPTGVTLRERPERGTPGFALVEASRSCDLVVVGSRGRGGIIGLLLGSTSTDVVANSHCPVAVIH
jgi:nucleotide-binding universal stress UspA family protein